MLVDYGGANDTRDGFEFLRAHMVEHQIRRRGIGDARVLAAMMAVPRHCFVPADRIELSYADQPLPIGEGQTISQPFMVAAMTNALALNGHERVLEIGAGSGYQAAVLSRVAREVIAVESRKSLAEPSRGRLARLGYSNVSIAEGDGSLGLPDQAPFDAIVVSASAPSVPQPLLDQLADGGRIVVPVGSAEHQRVIRIVKQLGRVVRETLYDCRFVPLVGRHGWPENFQARQSD